MNNETKMLLASQKMVKKSTIWILFLFLGWSYGSLGKIGKQIFFYLTFGGCGLWGLYVLFNLNNMISEYNERECKKLGLTNEEMIKLGVF